MNFDPLTDGGPWLANRFFASPQSTDRLCCDTPEAAYHRWQCPETPIYAALCADLGDPLVTPWPFLLAEINIAPWAAHMRFSSLTDMVRELLCDDDALKISFRRDHLNRWVSSE